MWLGNAVSSSTLLADPLSKETTDVFYIKNQERTSNPTVFSPLATNHFKTQIYLHPACYNYDWIFQIVYKSVATDHQETVANKIIFSLAHVNVYCQLSIQWGSFFVSATICAAVMSSADASVLSSISVLYHKYLQSRYQSKGMYPVTVMLFCVGLSVRNKQKFFHCSLIQSTVSVNITS